MEVIELNEEFSPAKIEFKKLFEPMQQNEIATSPRMKLKALSKVRGTLTGRI